MAPQAAEPDDGAYHASIVAITEGHFLTLSTAQAEPWQGSWRQPGPPPNQWVEFTDGRWISEKDPGYPFLAAPFEKLGIIRLAPLFYGALACLGLFFGARRWLGRFGGPAPSACTAPPERRSRSPGATMPTFTDASLIAAGSGALLWSMLATEASPRRRTWVGLAGFVAIEIGDLRPLHQYRDPRLRRRGRHRRRGGCESAGCPSVPCAGGFPRWALRRRRGHLRRSGLRRPAENRYPPGEVTFAPGRSRRICGSCPRTFCRPCRCWCSA